MRLKAFIAGLKEVKIFQSNMDEGALNLFIELAEAVQTELECMSPVKDNAGTAEEWHHAAESVRTFPNI